jgi:hypothetical protein
MTAPALGLLAAKMRDQALAFLAALSAEQAGAARAEFNADDRFDWHYIPRSRRGLSLKRMSGEQQRQAFDLLRLGLGEKGYGKAETIRQLEHVLRAIEGREMRDAELYFLTIFGEPSNEDPWGWRYEGHHISQNWTIVEGRAFSSTPQFFGANPAEVMAGDGKGTRALAAEEDLGRALVRSLDRAQAKLAIVSREAPPDIISAASRRASLLEDRGIGPDALHAAQESLLLRLLEEHAGSLSPALAEERLQKLRDAGLTRVRFAWMGGTERRQPHYYRIQGPTFLVEYDNTQNGANHVHVVFRDFAGDFGLDLLEDHYRRMPHGRHH